MRTELTALIKKHEGFRAAAYRDTRGNLTIGYGRLIDPRRGGGISNQEAEVLLIASIWTLVNRMQTPERQTKRLRHF